MSHKIVFSPAARADLFELYDYIAEQDGLVRAGGYIDRIEAVCLSLAQFPDRGRLRDDIRPGLRVTGFERRVAIGYHISDRSVVIDRILYGNRDMECAFT